MGKKNQVKGKRHRPAGYVPPPPTPPKPRGSHIVWCNGIVGNQHRWDEAIPAGQMIKYYLQKCTRCGRMRQLAFAPS